MLRMRLPYLRKGNCSGRKMPTRKMEEKGGLIVACFCNWCVRYYYYYLQAVNSFYDYPETYPIPVYDQNGTQIGTANNKIEYLAIWNADPTNHALGTLVGWYGPFGFKLITKEHITTPIPGFIIENIKKIYLWSDGQGNYIQDGNNNYITVK